uniref:50S ribosomal protein L25/general stress protein Ctc n=1 Tax=uncultured Draconibacterium sp. TaxID=1573823 RepID=UPI003217CC87
MKTVVLKGQKRESVGKKEAKRLRAQEIVPAVLYGGETPIHFSVAFAELRKLIYTPSVYLIDLEIDGQVYKSMMQDIQWHPVEEQVLHIDFLMVTEDKPVKIEVPLKISGHAKGIKMGGKLNTNLRRLKVKALAADLPDTIDVDVTKLGIGQSIKVADLNVPNVEFLDTKSNVVVSVAITRAAKSAAGAAMAAGDDEDEAEETASEE